MLIFVDTETSGLFAYDKPADAPGQPRLAQIGMIFVGTNREIQSQHEFLIRPRGWVMSPEATETTGITTEHLEKNGVPIDEALDLYQRAIEGRRVIAGFNVSYDLKVMRAELRHTGKPDLFMSTRSMCLMAGSRALVNALDKRGRRKAPRLDEACAHFGIEQPAAHSALADAMSAFQIWQKVLDAGAALEITDPYNKKPKAKPARRKAGEQSESEEGDETGIQDEIPL
jgi:DNA polymerase III epsilon subunit-like protein